MNDQDHSLPRDLPAPAHPSSRGVLRALLWSAFVISALGNTVASLGDAGIAIHFALGVVTAVCAAGLLIDWQRSRA